MTSVIFVRNYTCTCINKTEILSVRPADESKFNLVTSKKKYKILFFLKTNIDNVGPCRWSVNSFAVGSW